MMRFALLFHAVLMLSCTSTQIGSQTTEALPSVIVYKTTGDYYTLVPITLDESGARVTSYPAPSDLFTNGKLTLPVRLRNGFLYDQRGIDGNTAFTSFTYEEYSKLETAPSITELMNNIRDSNPFVEIYNCGKINEFKNPVKELNKLIQKDFKGCTSLMN